MAAGPNHRILVGPLASLVWLVSALTVSAQQASIEPTSPTPVPRVVWFSGAFQPADGQPLAAVETVTLAVYADQHVLLGSKTADGLPIDLFTKGEPRWIDARFDRAARTEQPRVLLARVH